MMSTPWDSSRWAIQTTDSGAIEIETTGGQTWALRSLVAAGEIGFRPDVDKRGHWAAMTAKLRSLGVPIEKLAPDASGLTGYRLGGAIHRVT